jgi:hypothetical protein
MTPIPTNTINSNSGAESFLLAGFRGLNLLLLDFLLQVRQLCCRFSRLPSLFLRQGAICLTRLKVGDLA